MPLGITARPVHEVLPVTLFAETVKVPLMLQATVPSGTACAGVGSKRAEKSPPVAAAEINFFTVAFLILIAKQTPLYFESQGYFTVEFW